MKWRSVAAHLVRMCLVGGFVAACAGPSATAAAGVDTAIVGSVRSGSAAPAWNAWLEERLRDDAARGGTWTFVESDGEPTVTAALPLALAGENDLTRKADLDALRTQAQQLMDTDAGSAEADILASLNLAARSLADGAGRSGTIYLSDSLLQTTGSLRFQDDDGALLSADPAAIADRVVSSRAVDDLTGLRVMLAGAGDTAAPQEPLPAPTRAALLSLWVSILQRAGATVEILQSPLHAPSHGGLPMVTPIPIHVVPIAPPMRGGPPLSLADASIGFLPDRAVLRDRGQALAMLSPVIAALRLPGSHATLTGTTSSAGTPEGRASLSLERAKVIANLLREGGAAASLEVRGVGADFPEFVHDRDGSGRLDPIQAARNRQVIIEVS